MAIAARPDCESACPVAGGDARFDRQSKPSPSGIIEPAQILAPGLLEELDPLARRLGQMHTPVHRRQRQPCQRDTLGHLRQVAMQGAIEGTGRLDVVFIERERMIAHGRERIRKIRFDQYAWDGLDGRGNFHGAAPRVLRWNVRTRRRVAWRQCAYLKAAPKCDPRQSSLSGCCYHVPTAI